MRTRLVASLALATAMLFGACASSAGGDITGPTWHLISITTIQPSFEGIVPAEAYVNYTLTFEDDGTFAAQADCNQVSGTYTVQAGSVIAISPGPSTLAFCGEESLGDRYVQALSRATSYSTADNQMTLTLDDNGTLSFQSGN